MRHIVGRLGTEPKAEHVGAGKQHRRTELIVMENTGTRLASGEWREDPAPTRHVVRAWGDLAEVAAQFDRGAAVIVVGRELTEEWTDRQTGDKRRQRVVEASHIGLNVREMDVRARRRQRPNIAAEAIESWETYGLARQTVSEVLSSTESDAIGAALRDVLAVARAQSQCAATDEERDGWERQAAIVHELHQKLRAASTITIKLPKAQV